MSEGLYNKSYTNSMGVREDQTTIVVRKETREKLKALRIAKRESYDEIINRLIDFFSKSKKTKEKA